MSLEAVYINFWYGRCVQEPCPCHVRGKQALMPGELVQITKHRCANWRAESAESWAEVLEKLKRGEKNPAG